MTTKEKMNCKDCISFIVSVIPELTFKLQQSPEQINEKDLTKILIEFTHTTVRRKDWIRTEFTLRIVQYLFSRVDNYFKSAISEQYWLKFKSLKSECTVEEWDHIKRYVPKELQMNFLI